LVFGGLILLAAGGLLFLAAKIPGIGRLPGDIFIKRENFTFYFPLATSIILSVIISFLFYFFGRK